MKLVLASVFLLAACAHPTYQAEMPDGQDKGITFKGTSLVFAIPAEKPREKMKLTFRGIHGGDELHLQLRFLRKAPFNPTQPERLDPKDLTVQLEGNGPLLTPTKIRASQKTKPSIVLNGDARQAVELIYKIPLAKNQKAQFAYFNFNWRVQYTKGKYQEQSVRFDREESKTNLTAIPYADPDFGQYDDMDDAGWFPMDSGWF